MKRENGKNGSARKRRIVLQKSDKVILGIIVVLSVLMLVQGLLQRLGLSLVYAEITLYLPILTLLMLVGWGVYALIRRIRKRTIRLALSALAVLVAMLLLLGGFLTLTVLTYATLPHRYKNISDASGAHKMVVMWQFDTDAERSQANTEARRTARLALYPDSSPEAIADDTCVVFTAYPTELGIFYREKADVEGEVCLAYTGNIAPPSTVEAAAETAGATEAPETAETGGAAEAATDDAEAAAAQVIELPQGTMMLEWLDDGATAHFYVDDPGVGEGGECTVRFDK